MRIADDRALLLQRIMQVREGADCAIGAAAS